MATETEQLIVHLEGRIAGFEKAMKQAEARGVATYQKLVDGSYKATTAMEKRMKETAEAMGSSIDAIFGQNKEWANRGAMNADFKAFMQSKAAVDQLRASIDPLFAASKRYEAAVRELDQALALGVMTEKEHAAALEQVGAAMLETGDSVTTHTGALGGLGNMSNATKAKIQGVGFQIQDFAVQVAGGTSATTAMAQQLPQLLGSFGLVGIAVGTLASVGLPLLGAAFGSAGDKAANFDSAIGAVENSIAAMNEQAAIYTMQGLVALKEKYGDVNLELMRHIELMGEATRVEAINATRDAMASLSAEMDTFWADGAWAGLQDTFKVSAIEANRMAVALREASEASTFEAQLAAVQALKTQIIQATGGIDGMTREQFDFYKKVLDSEDALRELSAAVPPSSWLGAALSGAQELVSKLWEGVRAKAALAGPSEGMTTGTPLFEQGYNGIGLPAGALLPEGKKGGSGSAGGGGGGGGSARIDALLADLQTEREIVGAWYAESLATLNSATEAQLAAVGGRHEALERLEREHQERLGGIRDQASGGALANAETFFGAMATLTAAGGEKLVKVQRATAAAEAFINTLRAQAAVLATPGLSVMGRFAAYAAIGSAGMKLVSALGGGGSAKAAASSNTASTSTSTGSGGASQPVDPLFVTLKGLDPRAIYSGQAIIDLATALQKEFGRRGLQLGYS